MHTITLLVLLCVGPRQIESEEGSRARTVSGRLFDALSGAPVRGASCELWSEDFDAPMELLDELRSAADGRFELRDERGIGEKVRVRAPGYRSTVFAGEDEVFLFPIDEPLVLRVLDLEGRPVAGARVRSHQTCRHAPPAVVGVSDGSGRVVIPDAPPFEDGPEYEVRARGFGALVGIHWSDLELDPVVYLPRRAEVRLRLLDEAGQPLAERRFRQQGSGHLAFTTDADGRAVLESLFESRLIELTECSESSRLVLGGWPALAGETTFPRESPDLEGRAEWPVLRVKPAELWSRLHVQFGNDSLTVEVEGNADLRYFQVRPGVPVLVLSQGDALHRAVLEPWSGTRVLDLTEPSTRVSDPRVEPAPVALAFHVFAYDGARLEAAGRLRWAGPEREDEDASPSGVLFHIPEGSRFEIAFSAEGFATVFRQGRAEAALPVAEPVPLARLTESTR